MNLSLRHVLPCSPADYWRCVLDEDYGRTLFVGILGFARYEIRSQVERNGIVGRIIDAEPRREGVPSMLHKLLPYAEVGTLTRARGEYVWHTEHNTDTSRTFGRMRVTACPGGCVREVEMSVHVAVPFLGGMLESRIADDAKRAWDASVAFTQQWLRAA